MWLALLPLWLAAAAAQAPQVHLPQGSLRGFTLTSRGGRPYSAFTKVPYAIPPLGPLRFQLAAPVQPWEGVYEANQELPFCLQIPIYDPYLRNSTRGTDDCLYLSVFSPNLTGSLPVMVYIHGGGWRSSAPGNGPATRSRFLMDEDVVLVAFNYRLAALGFLSTEDEVLPGNLGMKDQVAVLRWVKEHIATFGGDPGSVTIFGESVGGASTHLHLVSPLSKDLVSRAISQSGTAHSLWALAPPGVVRERTLQVAESLGCPAHSHPDMVDCLRTKTSLELIEAERQFNRLDYNPVITYPVVIEDPKVKDAFLPMSPLDVKVTKPWIAGYNSGEGAFKVISLKAEPALVEAYKSQFDEVIPLGLMYSNSSSDVGKVTQAIKEKFFKSNDSEAVMEALGTVFLESFFTLGLEEAVKQSEGSVYVYLFDHRGKTSSTDIVTYHHGVNYGDLGVSHTDELLYLFCFEDEYPGMMTEKDHQVSRRLIKRWTNFAKTGVPSGGDGEVTWNLSGEDRETLRIQTDGDTVVKNYLKDELSFWQSLPLRDKVFNVIH